MGNNSLNWQHFERSLACVVLDTKQSHMLFRTVAVFLCRGMLANANTPATTQWQVQGSYLPQRGRSEHRRTETRRVTAQQQQITELQSHSFTSPSSRRDVEPVAADFTSPCWVTDTCCRLLWFQRDFLGVWWRQWTEARPEWGSTPSEECLGKMPSTLITCVTWTGGVASVSTREFSTDAGVWQTLQKDRPYHLLYVLYKINTVLIYSNKEYLIVKLLLKTWWGSFCSPWLDFYFYV